MGLNTTERSCLSLTQPQGPPCFFAAAAYHAAEAASPRPHFNSVTGHTRHVTQVLLDVALVACIHCCNLREILRTGPGDFDFAEKKHLITRIAALPRSETKPLSKPKVYLGAVCGVFRPRCVGQVMGPIAPWTVHQHGNLPQSPIFLIQIFAFLHIALLRLRANSKVKNDAQFRQLPCPP